MKKLGLFVVLGILLGYVLFLWKKEPTPLAVAPDPDVSTEKPVAASAPELPEAPAAFPPQAPAPSASGHTAQKPPRQAPDDATSKLIEQTNALWNSGRGEEGLRQLKEALEQDPDNSQLLTQIGAMQMDLYDEPGPSLQYFSRAVQADPNNADALSALVELHARAGTLDRAEEFLRELPENSQASMALADIQLRKGRPEHALERLENHPEDKMDPGLVATAYLNSGRYEEAVEMFGKTSERLTAEYEKSHSKVDAKRLSLAQTDLANAHLQAGSLEQAMREARHALELDPHNRHARQLIQQIEQRTN